MKMIPEEGRLEETYMKKAEAGRRTGWKLGLMIGVLFLWWAAFQKPVQASDGYIIWGSDTRYLTSSEIADMPAQVVCYAKNEIYARHGRMFHSQELQNYFDAQYWYYGTISPEAFSPSYLNQYETANVDLLSKREKQLVSGGYVLDSAWYSYDPVYEYSGYGYDVEYYDNTYIFPDSNTRYLSQSEVNALTLQEICYAKNEIYARRGRMFQSQELTDYFNTKSWYWGTIRPENFSPSVFNSYETANIDLLNNTEQSRQAGGYVLDLPGYNIYAVRGVSSYSLGSEYIFYDSDSRYLTDAEVNALSCQMACYAKNEIYARHGRMFQSQELRNYFNSKSWYFGTISPENFSSSVLNKYEVANIEALKNREFSLNPAGYQLY